MFNMLVNVWWWLVAAAVCVCACELKSEILEKSIFHSVCSHCTLTQKQWRVTLQTYSITYINIKSYDGLHVVVVPFNFPIRSIWHANNSAGQRKNTHHTNKAIWSWKFSVNRKNYIVSYFHSTPYEWHGMDGGRGGGNGGDYAWKVREGGFIYCRSTLEWVACHQHTSYNRNKFTSEFHLNC